jgi:hypothetical protein
MKYLSILFAFLSFSAIAQIENGTHYYDQIPERFWSHPELKSSKYESAIAVSKYELVHERTKDSKTFLNTNNTKTTIQSSAPLHYLDASGFWLSMDYALTPKEGQIVYPSHESYATYNLSENQLHLSAGGQSIRFNAQTEIQFLDLNQTILSTWSANQLSQPQIKSDNTLLFEQFFSGIDKVYTFYNQAVKSDYVLNHAQDFPPDFHQMVLQETINLPPGFIIEAHLSENKKANRIVILNQNREIAFEFHQPVISDASKVEAKYRHLHDPYEAVYEIVEVDAQTYLIKTIIEGAWLLANHRVFPIVIDPVVTIENTDNVNSCFLPNYQQAPLSVAVPADETVLFSDIRYEFVATQSSGAWMSDQRSFVSSVSGSTPVVAGQGDNAGTYVYNLLGSSIANGTSSGQIEFVFHFARDWGGFSCNSTFNFVNKREIAVTYGTIVYGNGPVYVNEYSASNRFFSDGFNRTEDWIELYNASPDTYFDLTGYHLSNTLDNPTLWQIQNGLIPPDSRVLVFCSNRDFSSGVVLHANFSLTQLRPDQIVFADPNGVVLESYEMFVTQTNHSYGRISDGAPTWGVFSQATPGQANSNANAFSTYTTKPTFDVPAGRFINTVTIQLASTGPNEEIRYTLDGATPTTSSTLYTGPITITETTVVRARAFSPDSSILPGLIETNTYFINENSTLPVFSFSGDEDLLELFNGNIQLKPIGHFEYFENDGTFIDENLGDFDKHGNDSWNYPQRGVDFVSRDDHGYQRRLEHQFFSTSDRTRFRRLMVKAAANDNYPFQAGGAHIRDSYIQTLSQLSNLDLDERSSTNINLFVNGQYWGVYDLRERVDDNNFTNYYYNQDYIHRESDEYLQFLKTWGSTQAHFGNQPAIADWNALTQYIQNNDMGQAVHFDYVESQLNLQSFIDHFVLNSFVVSRDWLNYNTGWWRGTNPDGDAQKWRYIVWDMEAALGHFINYTGMPNVTSTGPPCQVENLNVGNGHAQSLLKLIQENSVVRQMYVTRYADLLNTHFSCENIVYILDSMINNIAPEMPRQIERWGGNIDTWQDNVQAVRDFLTQRCDYLMTTGLSTCYNLTGPFATTFDVVPANAGHIKMNSEWLPNYPFNAQVFGGIETLLQAKSNPGYDFSHWVVDGAVILPNDQTPNIQLQLSQATQVTAHFIDPTDTGEDLIYYWHFNTLETPEDVTSIAADYKIIPSAFPLMTYTGSGPRDIDANNNGSVLNLHLDEVAGRSARVRNPSDNRALVFDLPTTGYREIKFAYAVERTNSGQLQNIISYSTDGVNFITSNLFESEFNVSTGFDVISVDFSDISEVNNNPNFKISITFDGNTTALNGNNRFDNITLKGVEDYLLNIPGFVELTYQVYPNPSNGAFHIIASDRMKQISVYNVLGSKVFELSNIDSSHETIHLENLTPGLYLLKLRTQKGEIIHKVIKE